LPNVLQALAAIHDIPYAIAIVTNQSAVGRGLMTLDAAESINSRLLAEVTAAGGRIDGLYVCPHRPDEGCDCRKPRIGLITQAEQALAIDLSKSILIGDAESDLEAGRRARVRSLGLLLTGRGREQLRSIEKHRFQELEIFPDLPQALTHFFPESFPTD
jgi:D-glycero-D-manno-heptose 1,7-bisphosphate phosphatase